MQGGHCAVQGWTESLLSSLSLFLCFFTCIMGLDYIIATWLVVLCIVKAKHLSRIGKLDVSDLCICAVAVPSSSSWQSFQAAMKDNSDVHQRHSNVHTHTWVTVAVPLLLEKVIPQLQQGQLATPARLSAQKVQDLGTVKLGRILSPSDLFSVRKWSGVQQPGAKAQYQGENEFLKYSQKCNFFALWK